MNYSITVLVVPRGKGAVRHGVSQRGIPVHFRDLPTDNYMAAITAAAAPVLGAVRLEGPLRVDIVAVFPRTKELLRIHKRGPLKGCPVHGSGRLWAAQKPDGDNIRKAVQDALKPWLPDDKIIVCGDTMKAYCAMNEAPHLEIYISHPPPLDEYFQGLGLPLPYTPEESFEADGIPHGCPGAPPMSRLGGSSDDVL